MTIWMPDLSEDGRPRYEAIADAIARDVGRGTLSPGQRLPTHRHLARTLGLTVGTVSRAYAEANRRGLTVGEVGRGTFVQGMEGVEAFLPPSEPPDRDGERPYDLALALPWSPPDGDDARHLADTISRVARESCSDELLRYQPESASWAHRVATADWLSGLGVSAQPERVVVTSGSQHGLLVSMSAVLGPGDVLLTGELTYPGIKSLARMLGVRLYGVPLDDEGIRPGELARIARETSARALYCVPTFQNPTAATMSEERRLAVAQAAWEHDLVVIEDDLYAPVADHGLPALQAMAPERTIFLASFSKAVSFGLRVGAMLAPSHLIERLRGAVRASVWMPPPLMVEVAMRWATEGTSARVIERNKKELAVRHGLLVESLATRVGLSSHPRSLHAWMVLPEPWRSEDFVRVAAQRGIRVAGAEAFAVGRGRIPHAVRVSLGAEPCRERYEDALAGLVQILDGPAECCGGIL